MQVVVQVRIHPDNNSTDGVGELIDIATIDREGPLASSTVAMSIEEAKQILAGIDDIIVTRQTGRAIAAANDCAECGRRFASKDTRTIVMRSLYGTHQVQSPRWWRCRCGGGVRGTMEQDPAVRAAADRLVIGGLSLRRSVGGHAGRVTPNLPRFVTLPVSEQEGLGGK